MLKKRFLNLSLIFLLVLGIFLILYGVDVKFMLVLLHDVAHSISLVLSVFLMFVAVISYLREGGKRYLFLSAAFLVLLINEAITFLSTSFIPLSEPVIPLIGDPVSHWLNLAMITLLFIGILYKEGEVYES